MTATPIQSPNFQSPNFQSPDFQNPDRVILSKISWTTYKSLLSDFEQEPAIRLTYDNGTLEIRMPLDPHESYKKIIGRLIEAATEELGLEIRSLGSRTCEREDLTQGLEPDQCYYIQNEPLVRSIRQIDLSTMPPPDLAVEIDITSSSLNRFDIYSKLGVPEIWRFDGKTLTIHRLSQGQYDEINQSIALAPLKTEDFANFVLANRTAGENSLLRQFRETLRRKL
ncbi:MAG: Uma2 family endonuclease [Cyanobacteria bacterium J06621_11]